MIVLEYIWLDAYGKSRSKTNVINNISTNTVVLKLDMLPIWNYDGSSTGQATGNDSEVLIKPCYICKDPFRRTNYSYLVLCDTYNKDLSPHSTNTRFNAIEIFKKYESLEPLYGLEQEFFISKDGVPIGITDNSPEQKNYYCGTGGDNSIGRDMIEEAFDNCLYSELKLTGLNAEVAPSQWEFQICTTGINAADQLILLRYITDRTLEKYGYNMDLHPKPVKGDWNGSGCHTNFSTNIMRDTAGYSVILEAIKKLEDKHLHHMEQYGSHNKERMTGEHETSSYNDFSYGVANRGCSVRIPTNTFNNKSGYFEDRRPSSNMDPYVVTALILDTCCS